jgi:poly(3-hydroxybutyrate) depolymerase
MRRLHLVLTTRRRSRRRAVAFLSVPAVGLLSFISFAPGCSSDSKNNPGPAAADAGKEPQTPDDVPKVAIQASTDDCPGTYKDKAPAAGLNKNFEVDGQQRQFWVIYPDGDPTEPQPIFLAFNGTTEDGQEFSDRAQLDRFAKKGMVVVAPSSIGNGVDWPVWDSLRKPDVANEPNKDIDYVETLLKCVAAHRPIDKNRVYGGGHSAGGIFTNNIIQRKSEMFAGAIVASGVFSQTSPVPEPTMDKMLVIVTWGGDNDKYTGKAGTVDVKNFSFVPEASAATKFYSAQLNVGMARCRGDNLGHAWLAGLDEWFVDLMLAHPKGLPGNKDLELEPVPAGAKAACSTEVFDFKGSKSITCGASTKDGCQESCQLFASCAAANDTVSGVLATQLKTIGLDGEDCSACLTRCAEKSTAAADDDVLACMKSHPATECGQGIDGALPLINAVNACCKGKTDSNYCKDVCSIIKTNSAAINYFGACQAF